MSTWKKVLIALLSGFILGSLIKSAFVLHWTHIPIALVLIMLINYGAEPYDTN